MLACRLHLEKLLFLPSGGLTESSSVELHAPASSTVTVTDSTRAQFWIRHHVHVTHHCDSVDVGCHVDSEHNLELRIVSVHTLCGPRRPLSVKCCSTVYAILSTLHPGELTKRRGCVRPPGPSGCCSIAAHNLCGHASRPCRRAHHRRSFTVPRSFSTKAILLSIVLLQ